MKHIRYVWYVYIMEGASIKQNILTTNLVNSHLPFALALAFLLYLQRIFFDVFKRVTIT